MMKQRKIARKTRTSMVIRMRILASRSANGFGGTGSSRLGQVMAGGRAPQREPAGMAPCSARQRRRRPSTTARTAPPAGTRQLVTSDHDDHDAHAQGHQLPRAAASSARRKSGGRRQTAHTRSGRAIATTSRGRAGRPAVRDASRSRNRRLARCGRRHCRRRDATEPVPRPVVRRRVKNRPPRRPPSRPPRIPDGRAIAPQDRTLQPCLAGGCD